MEIPLVNNEYILEKFPGKGGWTYAKIPEIESDKRSPFGWIRVKGSIDHIEFKAYHLMPMGNGQLFLPVRAELRKKIGKKEGDMVRVILFKDEIPYELPEELKEIFMEEPKAKAIFDKHSDAEKKRYIEWIYASKSEETKVNRILQMLEKLK